MASRIGFKKGKIHITQKFINSTTLGLLLPVGDLPQKQARHAPLGLQGLGAQGARRGLGSAASASALSSQEAGHSMGSGAGKGKRIALKFKTIRLLNGEGGIRTLERVLAVTHLAGERIRPLCHLSRMCASMEEPEEGGLEPPRA
jgi:hypothetical protein